MDDIDVLHAMRANRDKARGEAGFGPFFKNTSSNVQELFLEVKRFVHALGPRIETRAMKNGIECCAAGVRFLDIKAQQDALRLLMVEKITDYADARGLLSQTSSTLPVTGVLDRRAQLEDYKRFIQRSYDLCCKRHGAQR